MSTAAPIQDQMILFPFRETMRSAYYARPDGAGPFPGVVVIHEAYGLNENIKDIARRFAREGYAALAVDLFAGHNRAACMSRLMYGMLVTPLKNGGLNELKAALDYLGEQPEVDSERIGAIGFCMGGAYAIAWACTDERLKAIAPFYGVNPRPLAAVARLCPVVGSYPGNDFSAGHGRKLDAALEQYHVPHDIKVYPGARHSFFNDQGRAYDAAASADAWQRILAFFGERISGTASQPKSAEA
ncbi:MAG TPA: dienelactone hydrolase family protein [Ktedonobacterales bacterium]|nr:dienelactone hydrolase family protein [Ktedonobacterales bacterium]